MTAGWFLIAAPGHGAPGLRSPSHALRRAGLASRVLRDWDGTLAGERDGHRMGTDALACNAKGSVGGVEAGGERNVLTQLVGCAHNRGKTNDTRVGGLSDGNRMGNRRRCVTGRRPGDLVAGF